MTEFISKLAKYAPVKDEFTEILEVEVDEEDRDYILAAAQKEKENMGKQLNIYKEKTV